MDYNKKLNSIMRTNKIKLIMSVITVIAAAIPFLIFLSLIPTLPPIGDRAIASYLMYIVVRSELNLYFRIAFISMFISIVSLVSLIIFNISAIKTDSYVKIK